MLKLNVPKKIGRMTYNFQVEGDNLHGVLMEAEKLSFQSVNHCGICKKENLYFRAYLTEKDLYEYVKVVCADCKASLTFGKVKNKKDTYFIRKREDHHYDWKEYQGDKPKQSEQDVPF